MAASLLVLERSARAFEIPRTLARSVDLDASGPERVPLPLTPTHVAFSWEGSEGTGVRFRLVDDSGSVGRWQRAPEAHDAERGVRHFTGVLAVPRPGAVVWAPVVPEGAWMDDVVLDAINTVDGPTTTVQVPAAVQAAPDAPNIVTRAEWGADESLKRTSGSCRRSFYDVGQLFVHHTAGRNNDPNPPATMRAILWYHAVRQGWCDVGYNFVIGSDGRVYEGRWARWYRPWEIHTSEDVHRRAVAGAHVSGYNSGSVGISLMGNFQRAPVPEEMKRSLAELLAWEVDRHHLRPKGSHRYRNPETGLSKRLPYIAGHRDAGRTGCPGGFLYRSLPRIRDDVKAVIGGGKTVSTTTLTVPKRAPHGAWVTLNGRVVDDGGAGLAGRAVKLYAKPHRGRWRVEQQVTSGVDGSFSATLTAEENLKLAAVYEGGIGTWGSQSATRLLGVRPEVTVLPENGTPDAFGIYQFPSGTTSVTLSGGVAPGHPDGAVKVKIQAVDEDGTLSTLVKKTVQLDSASSYAYDFAAPGPGRYRAVVWFVKDGDHAAAPSPPVIFEIAP